MSDEKKEIPGLGIQIREVNKTSSMNISEACQVVIDEVGERKPLAFVILVATEVSESDAARSGVEKQELGVTIVNHFGGSNPIAQFGLMNYMHDFMIPELAKRCIDKEKLAMMLGSPRKEHEC